MSQPPHNFLFVSLDGLIGDIAWRVSVEGHDVTYAITEDEFSQDVVDGIVPKVTDWEAHVGWADIVALDDSFGLGAHAERLRANGTPATCGTQLTDRLEIDREFEHETVADRGLDFIDSMIFMEITDGIEFIRSNPNPYVTCGETQNFNQLLYVGQTDDGEDVIQMLKRYRDVWDDPIEEFQLQRCKEGVEISVCRFFRR